MRPSEESPVVIGALGGSGTRLVAQILIDGGVYLGDDLNNSNDNWLFTRLFKDPSWFKSAKDEEIMERIRVLEKYLTGKALSPSDWRVFSLARKDNQVVRTGWHYFPKLMVRSLVTKRNDPWGWKEPNSHIFLKYLNRYFPRLKYIHVIRNGLDMALSKNFQQLKNWGYLFDIELPQKEKVPKAQLNYWIKSTNHVLDFCQNELKDRHYVLFYEKLCEDPKAEISNLLAFLNISIEEDRFQNLTRLPKQKQSIGRYLKEHHLFDPDQIEQVRKLGYQITCP